MREWKEIAMSLRKKLDKSRKLCSKEKEYRGKLTSIIYSLKDQLEEYKGQSERRHNELNGKYQQQIQQIKSAEALCRLRLELEVTALRQDRDAKSKFVEKLQQQIRVSRLAQGEDSECSTSNNCDNANGQSKRNQNLPIFGPKLKTEPNEPSSRCIHHEHGPHSEDQIRSTIVISSTKDHEDNNSTRAFQCTQCDLSFKRKGDLKVHIHYVHEKVVNYRCSHCSKGFYLKKDCTAHLRVHTMEKPFQCTICSKAFARKSVLKRHMVIHSDESSFQCTKCNASFKRAYDLTEHLLIHSDKFECEFCGKRFKTQMKCREHVGKFHSDNRPYPCTQCDSAFNSKSNLVTHIRKVHEKVVNYRCGHCSKGFYYRSNLIKHLRVHTGERPFQCKECSKTYKRRSDLTRHERSIHGAE